MRTRLTIVAVLTLAAVLALPAAAPALATGSPRPGRHGSSGSGSSDDPRRERVGPARFRRGPRIARRPPASGAAPPVRDPLPVTRTPRPDPNANLDPAPAPSTSSDPVSTPSASTRAAASGPASAVTPGSAAVVAAALVLAAMVTAPTPASGPSSTRLGLARPLGEPPAGGRRRGSPPWMAPEQVRRRPASRAMDLFALGAVLYELATGTPAFEVADQGPPERRWPQRTGPPPPPSRRNPELPAALDRAVIALLTPDPAHRPAGAARRWPCWRRPCRPTRPRRTGSGPAGLPRASAPGKRPPWRVPRSLHDLRSPCRWPRDAPCQDGYGRKDFGSLRDRYRSRPSWGPGGAAGGCARSPGAGLPRGR